MKKKDWFLALSLVSLVLFVAVILLAVTDFVNLNPIFSVVFLVSFAMFIILYTREKNQAQPETDFVAAERARTVEVPKHVRDFEIVKDCCESIVAFLKEDRNIVGIGTSNHTYEYEGYYDFKEDRFEFLDCLYFFTYEMIEEISPEFLAVLEDGFLTKKFSHIDATYSEDNIFLFKRDDETFYETFYVYSEAPDAFANSNTEYEKLGGYWYYVTSNKNFTEWFNI